MVNRSAVLLRMLLFRRLGVCCLIRLILRRLVFWVVIWCLGLVYELCAGVLFDDDWEAASVSVGVAVLILLISNPFFCGIALCVKSGLFGFLLASS